MENFGKSVRALRKKKHLSAVNFAMTINISDSYLGQIERGERVPTVDIAVSIINALGVSFCECNVANNNSKSAEIIDLYSKIDSLTENDSKFLYNSLLRFIAFGKGEN